MKKKIGNCSILSAVLLLAGTAATAMSFNDGLKREYRVSLTVTNRTSVDFKAGTEAVTVRMDKLFPPAYIAKIRPNSIAVSFNGKELVSQFDDMNRSGTVDGADELSFMIPSVLPKGNGLTFHIFFSSGGEFPKPETEAMFEARKIANFTRVSCENYTIVFNNDSGTVNTLYLNTTPRITLAKSPLHSPLFSFIGSFYSPEQKKQIWQDRLMSWQFKGNPEPPVTGPVRAILKFKNNRFRNNTATLDFDDSYDAEYLLYPGNRIIVRLTMNQGEKKDTSYQMIFTHLSLALPQKNTIDPENPAFPFNFFRTGDADGSILEKIPVPADGDFNYMRPVGKVLSFMEGVYEGGNGSFGIALIVNPDSFMLTRSVKNTPDSMYGWNYIRDFRRGQCAFRKELWSGREFNLAMSSSEWPSRLFSPETPRVSLESCIAVWQNNDTTEYTARALRSGSLSESSYTVSNIEKLK